MRRVIVVLREGDDGLPDLLEERGELVPRRRNRGELGDLRLEEVLALDPALDAPPLPGVDEDLDRAVRQPQ